MGTWHAFVVGAHSAAANAKTGARPTTTVPTMLAVTAALATWHAFVVGAHSAAANAKTGARPTTTVAKMLAVTAALATWHVFVVGAHSAAAGSRPRFRSRRSRVIARVGSIITIRQMLHV